MYKRLLGIGLLALVLSLLLVAAVSAEGPDDATLSGEFCKTCHPAQYDEWAGSLHPMSVEAIKSNDHASSACYHCMSVDGRLNEELTLEEVQYGVTCIACHTPHDTPGDALPKIDDVAATCKACHNAELEEGVTEAEPGATLRHPVKEMFAGVGAIGVANTQSKHFAFGCNTCHLEGHLYEASQDACDKCHGGAQTIAGLEDMFSAKLEEWGAIETLADDDPAAYTNYTLLLNDKSFGAHNFTYYKATFDAVEAALGAEAPLPVTGGEVNGVASLVLGGGLSLMLVGASALLRRKK